MAIEKYADFDWYYPCEGAFVEFTYEVALGKGDPTEPHKDADRCSAVVYCRGEIKPENELATFPLNRHRGEHIFELDLNRYTVDQSPLIVDFSYEREFLGGPRRGIVETRSGGRYGVVLARPAVGEVAASQVMLRIDERAQVTVSRWGAQVYDTPGAPPRLALAEDRDLARFPPWAKDEHVRWTMVRDREDPRSAGEGPLIEHQWRREDEGTKLYFSASLCEQAELPSVTVIGSSLSFRLSYTDPEGQLRPFPPRLPIAIEYDDGARDVATVGADGCLLHEIERERNAFTLSFAHETPTFVAVREGDADMSATADEIDSYVLAGWSVFRLPDGSTFQDLDWTIFGEATPDPETHFFEGLRTPTQSFGTKIEPIELELDPHWVYLRFEFFDRAHGRRHHGGRRVGVPNLLVNGARSAPEGRVSGDWDAQAAWPLLTDDSEASCQAIPFIQVRGEDHEPLPPLDGETMFSFAAPGRFVECLSPYERVIIRPRPGDPRLDPGPERFLLCDLPEEWTSINQFVRGPDRFAEALTAEDLAAASDGPGAPLVFSLDDLVLVTDVGDPCIWREAPLSAESRLTLLAFDPADGFRLKVHAPREGASYYSDVAFERNLLLDCSPDVRAIVFRGEVYAISDKRTSRYEDFEPAAGDLLGVRAAVRGDPDVVGSRSVRGVADPLSRHDVASFDLHYLHNAAVHYDRETLVSGMLVLTSLDVSGDEGDVARWSTGGVDALFRRWNATRVWFEPTTSAAHIVHLLTLVLAATEAESWGDGPAKTTASLVSDDREVAFLPGALTLRRSDWISTDRRRGRASREPTGGDGPGLLPGAHALGHVLGLGDEHLARLPGWGVPAASQHFAGMPYAHDPLTVMGADRQVRLRHHLAPLVWLNEESADHLDRFLGGVTFQLLGGNACLDPSDGWDPWVARDRSDNASLGLARVDLLLYRADREMGALVGERRPGVVVVRTVVHLTHRDGAEPWTDRWRREWTTSFDAEVCRLTAGRFVLEPSGPAEVGRTDVVFEVRYGVGPEAPAGTHVAVTVSMDESHLQVEPGAVRCGVGTEPEAVALGLYGGGLDSSVLDPLAAWVGDAVGVPFSWREVAR